MSQVITLVQSGTYLVKSLALVKKKITKWSENKLLRASTVAKFMNQNKDKLPKALAVLKLVPVLIYLKVGSPRKEAKWWIVHLI